MPEPEDAMTKRKRCPRCDKDLPLDRFYVNQSGKHGRATYCKNCENTRSRPATPKKINRTRARHRAVADLIAAHPEEFEGYKAVRLREAEEEAEELTRAAADLPRVHQHQHQQKQPEVPEPVRLRPGRRQPGQPVTERIDVARCGQCRRYHDSGHKCGACGTAPSPVRRPLIRPASQIMADIRASGGK